MTGRDVTIVETYREPAFGVRRSWFQVHGEDIAWFWAMVAQAVLTELANIDEWIESVSVLPSQSTDWLRR